MAEKQENEFILVLEKINAMRDRLNAVEPDNRLYRECLAQNNILGWVSVLIRQAMGAAPPTFTPIRRKL